MGQDCARGGRATGAAAIVLLCLAWSGEAAERDCAAGMAEPATPPGGESTAPGNAATGWSGGLGGAFTGTTSAGAAPASRTWQPPTARGLDLAGSPEPAPC